jgi:hypothetical protein
LFSNEYKSSSTVDERREENDERLYNQAEPVVLNDGNVNANVHSVFDRQGLSTTSFDRHASSFPSSSFLLSHEDYQHQQGNENHPYITSHSANDQATIDTQTMFPHLARSQQDVSYDIENCVLRCFEAHQQRVARRRSSRRNKRHPQATQGEATEASQQIDQYDQYQSISGPTNFQNYPTSDINSWQAQVNIAFDSFYARQRPDHYIF